MAKKTITMYDPPNGWKYGFPKPIPEDIRKSGKVLDWIVSQGYPKAEIDAFGNHFCGRYWEQEIDE
jgi:hypothetical protein